jgi:hypothetical protein
MPPPSLPSATPLVEFGGGLACGWAEGRGSLVVVQAARTGATKAAIRRPVHLSTEASSCSSGVAPLSWRWPPWFL